MRPIKTGINRVTLLDSIVARLRAGRPRKRILFRAGASEFFFSKVSKLALEHTQRSGNGCRGPCFPE